MTFPLSLSLPPPLTLRGTRGVRGRGPSSLYPFPLLLCTQGTKAHPYLFTIDYSAIWAVNYVCALTGVDVAVSANPSAPPSFPSSLPTFPSPSLLQPDWSDCGGGGGGGWRRKEELERPYTGREEKRAEGRGRMYANEGEDVEEKKRPAAEDGGRTSRLLPASDVSQTRRRPLFFRTETCARPRGPPGVLPPPSSYARFFLNGAAGVGGGHESFIGVRRESMKRG